jgi:hypothetical protein
MLKTSAKVNGNANSHLFFNSSAPLTFGIKQAVLLWFKYPFLIQNTKKACR